MHYLTTPTAASGERRREEGSKRERRVGTRQCGGERASARQPGRYFTAVYRSDCFLFPVARDKYRFAAGRRPRLRLLLASSRLAQVIFFFLRVTHPDVVVIGLLCIDVVWRTGSA